MPEIPDTHILFSKVMRNPDDIERSLRILESQKKTPFNHLLKAFCYGPLGHADLAEEEIERIRPYVRKYVEEHGILEAAEAYYHDKKEDYPDTPLKKIEIPRHFASRYDWRMRALYGLDDRDFRQILNEGGFFPDALECNIRNIFGLWPFIRKSAVEAWLSLDEKGRIHHRIVDYRVFLYYSQEKILWTVPSVGYKYSRMILEELRRRFGEEVLNAVA